MGANLIEQLQQVEDLRTTDGRRHQLWLVLLTGTRKGKKYHEIVCYISSLICTAKEFALGIRSHWGIENSLHWVKDVVFKEDNSTIRLGNAPANLSILRAIALNILRRNGHTSITIAQRFLSHDIDKLLALVE